VFSGSSGGGGGYQALGPGECLGRALFPFRGTEVCPDAASAVFEARIADVEAGISRAELSRGPRGALTEGQDGIRVKTQATMRKTPSPDANPAGPPVTAEPEAPGRPESAHDSTSGGDETATPSDDAPSLVWPPVDDELNEWEVLQLKSTGHTVIEPMKFTPPAGAAAPPAADSRPFTPPPTEDQLEPSHFAMQLALIPPALVNRPPAYSARPEPSSNAARENTELPIPPPTGDQVDPSHLAMNAAGTPATDRNLPPA